MAGFEAFQDLQSLAAIEKTPLMERLEGRNVYAVLAAAAERFHDRTAIVDLADPARPDEARSWTYAQAFEAVTRAANALHRAARGTPVGYLLPNLAETHFVLWAAAAGAGAAPVNPMLSADVIAEILEAAGAGCLVTTPPGTPLHDKALEARRRVSAPLAVIPLSGDDDALDALMASASGGRLAFDPGSDPDRPAAYFHTGGTTGAPKLACQTQINQAAMIWMLRYALDLGEADVALTGLPLFHANAAHLTGLAPLTAGSTLLLAGPDGFRNKALLENFWKIVERYGVTMFSGVPTIYASLLDHPVAGADVSSLRYGVVGAAPMPVSVFKAFEKTTGIRILELYGMTESTCVSTCNPRDGERRVGSIGLRMPYHEVKVAVLGDDGTYERDAEAGEAGVLALRGITVIPGYKQAERNKNLFLPGGWLNSGDLGRMDAEGYFWLIGRAKDLIIRGGHNIDPGAIEDVLHAHPDVELAAAVGQPDAYAGEVPVVYAVLREGAAVDEAGLIEFARERVAERPAAPKAVRVLDEMPVTAVGKIFKPALREDAAVHAARAALADADVGNAQVEARTDKARGLVVSVIAPKNGERAVQDVLADFNFETEFSSDD